MYELIGTIQKNSIERIKVELSEFHGYNNVAIRVFKSDPLSDGEIPIKKGLTCNVSRLPQLIGTLTAAEHKARELGILVDEDE